MAHLIDDLLRLAHLSRASLRQERVDLTGMAAEIAMRLQDAEPERRTEIRIAKRLEARGDPGLLRIALENASRPLSFLD